MVRSFMPVIACQPLTPTCPCSGGGIAGLCLAVALSKYQDIDVAVYEAASSFREIGAGVMVWGRTWRILTLLGLDKAFRELAGAAIDGSEGALL